MLILFEVLLWISFKIPLKTSPEIKITRSNDSNWVSRSNISVLHQAHRFMPDGGTFFLYDVYSVLLCFVFTLSFYSCANNKIRCDCTECTLTFNQFIYFSPFFSQSYNRLPFKTVTSLQNLSIMTTANLFVVQQQKVVFNRRKKLFVGI